MESAAFAALFFGRHARRIGQIAPAKSGPTLLD
jgi:hypothetical protein